jgi:hypothetical protein
MDSLQQVQPFQLFLLMWLEIWIDSYVLKNGSLLVKRNILLVSPYSIILTVVLYGCEAWSLTLREERRLRVFENSVLRRIFGPKRDDGTGEWRKIHNEEFNDLYS